jgi:hypothetical protein
MGARTSKSANITATPKKGEVVEGENNHVGLNGDAVKNDTNTHMILEVSRIKK